jgi:hypothetical protein
MQIKTKIWIVVIVERGFPAELIVCEDHAKALRRGRRESMKLNQDYDSIGIFCIDISKKRVEQLAFDC